MKGSLSPPSSLPSTDDCIECNIWLILLIRLCPPRDKTSSPKRWRSDINPHGSSLLITSPLLLWFGDFFKVKMTVCHTRKPEGHPLTSSSSSSSLVISTFRSLSSGKVIKFYKLDLVIRFISLGTRYQMFLFSFCVKPSSLCSWFFYFCPIL